MSDNQDSEILEHFACGLHHFHIDHNTSCLAPKFCITIVFDFSWDDYNTQEKLETMVMQILGVNKMHYGLCENGESPV